MARERRNRRQATSVRLADIAEQAGVSTATVSRALNQPEKVTPAVRERVLQTIQELNWVPHGAAKALATHKTRTIGAITDTLGNANIAAELEALQEHLMAAGYVLLLACSGLDERKELEQVRKMIERGIDALVLHHSASHSPALWKLLEVQRVPAIITRAAEDVPGYTTVGYSAYTAFRELTTHLLKLGHRRFGLMMITSPQNEQAHTLDPDKRVSGAYAGVIDTLREAGLEVRPEHTTNTYFSIGKGRDCFRKIMSTTPQPTALICMDDYLAVGSIFEAQAMGVRVPEDVSIVGFDDIELAQLVSPPLTTIRTPDREMGAATAECVLDMLEQRAPAAYRRELGFEFLLRGSTAPPPANDRAQT
jgi:LacI family transcriptional regulator